MRNFHTLLDNLCCIAITNNGIKIANMINKKTGCDIFALKKLNCNSCKSFDSLKEIFKFCFDKYQGIVAIMSLGIVIRMIGNLIRSKYTDPAVVVIDDAARFCISSLSGHEGGANRLSHYLASIIGCQAVITTATETNKRYVMGIGTRKNIDKEIVKKAIIETLNNIGLTTSNIRVVASCWLKQNEQGLVDAAKELKLETVFLPKQLYKNELYCFKESAAIKHIGIKNVAEASALLASTNPRLILPKTDINGVSIAIVEEQLL
ncbi:cobalamin biosynthesis protein [Hippea jasoniae]|uniref:cobalamin biosynthesis protein n=1 Tax=Hippea jasoniae TaxID=944479 RepID=UPI00068B6256|nr:cobalamin biosynthesis protein [Hippea jasoniae]